MLALLLGLLPGVLKLAGGDGEVLLDGLALALLLIKLLQEVLLLLLQGPQFAVSGQLLPGLLLQGRLSSEKSLPYLLTLSGAWLTDICSQSH